MPLIVTLWTFVVSASDVIKAGFWIIKMLRFSSLSLSLVPLYSVWVNTWPIFAQSYFFILMQGDPSRFIPISGNVTIWRVSVVMALKIIIFWSIFQIATFFSPHRLFVSVGFLLRPKSVWLSISWAVVRRGSSVSLIIEVSRFWAVIMDWKLFMIVFRAQWSFELVIFKSTASFSLFAGRIWILFLCLMFICRTLLSRRMICRAVIKIFKMALFLVDYFRWIVTRNHPLLFVLFLLV